MKILIVNTFDKVGGAARSAYRLHEALLKQGVDSQMLVQSKSSNDFRVLGPETKLRKALCRIRPAADRLPLHLYKHRANTPFSPAYMPFSDVAGRINALAPDIVHLHWITSGMMRIEDIAKINAPIVWSLHDDWAFTGGCHIKWQCDKFMTVCGSCPRLGSNKDNDLSRKVFNRKKDAYSKTKSLTIIGLSRWLADCASKSSLLENKKILNIPNPIDTKTFSPYEKKDARKLFNLPDSKSLVLFGSNGSVTDINKGFNLLLEALDELQGSDIELVVFGSDRPQSTNNIKQKTHYLGHLYDDISLRALYSAADVMVVPSLQENLSNTIMESMACGTPVVGFNTGGNSDLIEHEKNGYLADPFDTKDLARGVKTILDSENYAAFSQHARDKVLREFDDQVVVGKYLELYEQLIAIPVD